MKTSIAGLLLIVCAAGVPAHGAGLRDASLAMQQSAAPDTAGNRALQEMLSQYSKDPEATALPYESWTFDAHRYLGYAIVAATATQVILGWSTWNARKEGKEPGAKTAHKYIGYTTAGLSLAQSSIGFVNFWRLRDKESGNTKRLVHLGMSAIATAGFVTAAALAYGARRDIDEGTAARENKTFDDLYSNHRAAGIVSGVSVLLTVIVIEW